MKQTHMAIVAALARLVAAGALMSAILIPLAATTHAAGNRPLQASDFFGFSVGSPEATNYDTTAFLVSDPSATIAGVKYARAVSINACDGNVEGVSLNTARLPGYKAISFDLGMVDRDSVTDAMTFTVTADGNPVYSKTLRQGQMFHVVAPFSKAQVLSFSANEIQGDCVQLIMGNPEALAGGAPPAGSGGATSPGGATSLHIVSTTVLAGGLQQATVTTAKRASVTLVVTYPDGSQAALGPRQATSGGHLTFTWTVPAGLHGTVRVVAVSSGVAQGTFQVQ